MTDFTARDIECMTAALRLAERGANTARPNPVVGCVVVDSTHAIIGQGWHERAGKAHAEVAALAEAGDQAAGATAYVTLEPCSHHGRTPPCADQLIAAGISRVIYAVEDPNPAVAGQGVERLRQAGIKVDAGLLAADAARLNRGFFSRMQRRRPWVSCKLAISLDGRTALANGKSQWITGGPARDDVHRFRARSGALVTGIGTVLNDDPMLTARGVQGELANQPLRVVLDSELKTPVDARLFETDSPVMIIHSRGNRSAIAALRSVGAEVLHVADYDDRPDLMAVMSQLAEAEINDVWVEAGAGVSGEFLRRGLIDELIVYQAASVLGGNARGMFDIADLADMEHRPEFELMDVRKIGSDLRLCYVPAGQ